MWLVHRDGFSLASQLKSEELSLPEGKARVKLDHDGAILDVDEDDIEKANAPSCDRLEDLASLVYLNESSVLHTLRQRYGASLLHTYAGPSLLVLSTRGAPAVYSEKVCSYGPTHLPYPTFPVLYPSSFVSTEFIVDLDRRVQGRGQRDIL